MFRLRTTIRRSFGNQNSSNVNQKQRERLQEYYKFPKEYSPWRLNHYTDGVYAFCLSASLFFLGYYMKRIYDMNGSLQLDEEFDRKSLFFK